ncbi:MAG: tyrosine-type recombinase/integrase, partial [Planctomycetaceae bacterium]|nr:tyrosine-type recombinase/integrase [Planctomycetaceae bacterium]
DADQVFKLLPDTLAAIAATEPARRDLLFPWPHCRRHFYRGGYQKILAAAGLTSSSRDLFHKIRRTHATQLANATDIATAQKSLGHANRSTTLRYIDPRYMTDQKTSAEFLPRLSFVPCDRSGEPC